MYNYFYVEKHIYAVCERCGKRNTVPGISCNNTSAQLESIDNALEEGWEFGVSHGETYFLCNECKQK